MWQTVAEFHAAVNDLPAALFIAALGFDIAGFITKKDSLHTAAFWTLMIAASGAVAAVVSGLRAEHIIEHGSVMHRSIVRHRNLAIGFTVLACGLAGWRIARRDRFVRNEMKSFLAASAFGAIALVWTAKVGGSIVFRHAGGIRTSVLESAIAERAAGHAHAPGEGHDEADHEHDDAAAHDESDSHNADESEPHSH